MCNYFNVQDANGYISYSAQTVQKKWGALSVEAQVEHVRLADLQMKSLLGEPPYAGEALPKWIAAAILIHRLTSTEGMTVKQLERLLTGEGLIVPPNYPKAYAPDIFSQWPFIEPEHAGGGEGNPGAPAKAHGSDGMAEGALQIPEVDSRVVVLTRN